MKKLSRVFWGFRKRKPASETALVAYVETRVSPPSKDGHRTVAVPACELGNCNEPAWYEKCSKCQRNKCYKHTVECYPNSYLLRKTTLCVECFSLALKAQP